MKIGFRCVLLLAQFALCLTLSPRREFDHKIANTSIWLSSGAYCPPELYLTREYIGYSEGFVATNAIVDPATDTQGYIGYHPEQSNIYVVLRGTHSLQNWINDFDARMVKFNGSEDCVNCYVHEGFSYAWSRVALNVVADVAALRAKFPSYSIVVTGHSLGGALASLAALHLQLYFNSQAAVSNQFSLRAVQKLGMVPKIRMFTFGAPRFSNQALSEFATKLLEDRHRITHYRDICPHVPPYWQYIHIAGEWYEDEFGQMHTCTGYEDPDCADRWYYTSVDDHMHYLGLPIGCSAVTNGLYQSTLFPDPPSTPSNPVLQGRPGAKVENLVPGEVIVYKSGGKPSDDIP